jgi:phosphatidylinositol alpha-1,6-mannosyltransferase
VNKTLVITNDFPPRRGGIETFVFSLCNDMPPDEVVVYTARMEGSEEFDADVDYPVIRDRARILLPTFRVGRGVRRVAREQSCDRVVFGAAAPLGLLASGLRRAGVQEIVGITHGHEVWWAKVPIARQLLRRIGETTDYLTFVSEFCRLQISPALSRAAAGRMRRLSPAIDRNRFRPGMDRRTLRRRWGLAPERPVVLAASRLVRRKGQDTLIKAWPSVLERHPEAALLIVGDGPSKRRLVRMVRRRGLASSVIIRPSVPWDVMPHIYATADVFALPCRTRLWGLEVEAFGLVFLEASAAGLPVLVGDSGGAVEAAVTLGGFAEFVCDPKDASAVAKAVAGVLQHLGPAIG